MIPGRLNRCAGLSSFSAGLELAASELSGRLARLPAGGWRIEPYPLTGERRNTFGKALPVGLRGFWRVEPDIRAPHAELRTEGHAEAARI